MENLFFTSPKKSSFAVLEVEGAGLCKKETRWGFLQSPLARSQ
jgi:hypothetical protein